jgi:hypothetical protein
MNTLVLAPQVLPLSTPWLPEDTSETAHEYFIPRSLALYVLRVIRRYPGVDSMLMLGLHPRHHGLQVWYTDGTTKTFRTVEDILHHWAMICWNPPGRG